MRFWSHREDERIEAPCPACRTALEVVGLHPVGLDWLEEPTRLHTLAKRALPPGPRGPGGRPGSGRMGNEMIEHHVNYLTQEGYAKLEQELIELRDQRREEIAHTLRDILASGDLEDSTEYDMVKAEQAFVEGRIRELEVLLATARVIEPQASHNGMVQVGSRVTIQEEGYPDESFQIVGPAESNAVKGKISYLSPLGRALMDRKAGDGVKVSSPDGSFMVKILRVE